MPTGLEVAVGQALLSAGASFATASAIITAAPAIIAGAALFTTEVVLAERARAAFADASRSSNSDAGQRVAIPQASPEHRLALGYANWVGSPFFKRGGVDTRPYFWIGLLLSAGESDGLVAIYINNTRVTIDPVTGLATSTPFNNGVISYVEASFRNGSIDQEIDAIIARDFPEIASTFRQRGHTTIVIKLHYGDGANVTARQEKHKELYGDGSLQLRVEYRGAKYYDPRGLNQSLADTSTYAWGNNASLCAAHAIRWYQPGQIFDWGRMAAAADIDDGLLITKSLEAIRRHTLDGLIRSGDEAAKVIPELLSSNGGQLLYSKGRLYILPHQVKRPVGTLHRGNMVGPISYQPERRLGETINEVRPSFFSVEAGFNIIPGPVIRKQVDVDADGVENASDLPMPYTRRHERSQALAVPFYKRGRVPATASASVDMSGRQWAAGEVITFDRADIHPGLTGEWEIVEKAFDTARGTSALQLRKYSAEADSYDAQTEEQTFSIAEAA